jgi:hypothetical protein
MKKLAALAAAGLMLLGVAAAPAGAAHSGGAKVPDRLRVIDLL